MSLSINRPLLSFESFKEKWSQVTMESLFPKIRNGFVGTATPFYVNSGIAYLQGKNIQKGFINKKGLIFISSEFHSKQKKSQLKYRDILMVQSGHVGECAVVNKEFQDSNCHALLVLTPLEDVNSQFYKNYFYTKYGRKKIHKITTGNTIKHILSSDLKKVEVPLPSLPEQQKIADFLSTVDKKIQALNKKKELLESYQKGVMQQIFKQEIRFRKEDGSDYPKWEEKRLGELGEFIGGGTPNTSIDEYWNGRIGWVSSSDIYNDNIHKVNIHKWVSEKGLSDSATKLIPKHSILIVSRVGLGKFAVNEQEICTSQDFTNITLTEGNPYFYAYMFLELKKIFLRFSQGTSIKGFTSKEIKLAKFTIPSIEEQTKIANFLTAIDDKINVVVTQIDKMKEWKKGLLQQMFV